MKRSTVILLLLIALLIGIFIGALVQDKYGNTQVTEPLKACFAVSPNPCEKQKPKFIKLIWSEA